MKCILCDKYFAYEVNFMNLFNMDDICKECKLKFAPKLHIEVFPIENGLIHYYYLYDNISINRLQKDYLSKHLNLIYVNLQNSAKELVVFITEDNIEHIKDNLKYIIGFRYLVFMSLTRMNFDDCVVFY